MRPGLDDAAKQRFGALMSAGEALFDEPMSAHTTFRIGGPADVFLLPQTIEEIAAIQRLCHEEGIPLYVMGSGSNVLVSDDGLHGVVMRLGPKFSKVTIDDSGRVHAQAGASNAKIARVALDAGLTGFEFAAGIPGTIGGAAIMNAGAYDGELKDVALSFTSIDEEGEVRERDAASAEWGYRSSAMQKDGSIVVALDMQLQPGDPEQIKARMDELAQRRSDKQPLDKPSAGSTFKRPEGDYAGRLIQGSGAQGYRVGGAQVSMKHAGFIVNTGGAKASDVYQLIYDVVKQVKRCYGVTLEPEVRMWGF